MSKKNSLTPKVGDQFDIVIDSLSYHGGRGVGRHEGMVVFVAGASPGDRLSVEVTANKGRFLEAAIQTVLERGPHFRQAPCPVAGECGGCAWQQVTYEEQLRQKQKILLDATKRLRARAPFEFSQIVAAPEEFHYRNRIQLHRHGDQVGFFATRSRQLVPIESCRIAEEGINRKISELRTEGYPNAEKFELAMQPGDEVQVYLPDERAGFRFSQVNSAQNSKLIELVLNVVDKSVDWAMDLYCGSGNLTLPLAGLLGDVPLLAVELDPRAIERAKSAKTKITWQAGDVASVLKRQQRREGKGVVVLDPPRLGADRAVLSQIQRFRPNQIVYVSCNPTTFARDAEILVESGYRIQSATGLDMFPQTEHVELVAALRMEP
ncbi:MAG: class I SAM-dependent RNA methyltransferase [Bdellovibrionales bacterium]